MESHLAFHSLLLHYKLSVMLFGFFKRKKKQRPILEKNFNCSAIAFTDKGEIKEVNEDRLVFINPFDDLVRRTKGCIAIVCDGMGGHNSGDYAAQLAIDNIPKNYYDAQASFKESLNQAIQKANQLIFQTASRNTKHAKMGTTCTAVVILDQDLFIAHAGDSRIYSIAKDDIHLLTTDHTYVEHLFKSGLISKEEKDTHPDRNIVTKVIGTQKSIEIDNYYLKNHFKNDQKLLLCSDGLYDYIKDDEIKKVVNELDKEDAAKYLIDTAKKRGGHDNISVLIVDKQSATTNSVNKKTKEVLS